MADNYLVTGSRGGSTPHVTSSQARNFNAGIVGGDRYVMEGLDCVVTSANKVHVGPGVACFCGADVEVPPGGADLSIDNGSQGMKRNDLVVLRYNSDSPEGVTLAVVKGTPSASSPSDPSYNDGDIRNGDSPVDMPLYRVPLDGISVGDPEPVYETVPSIADLRYSVSHAGKRLWHSSGYYMMSSQSAELSEPVSSQLSGIVLVWRQYSGGAALVGSAHYQYVPKAAVADYPGMGAGCLMTSATTNVIGSKYVYVSDTSIKGHDANNRGATTASSGLTVTPNAWVLTDVYGV